METPVKPSTAINKPQPVLAHSCALGLEPLEAEGSREQHGAYPDKASGRDQKGLVTEAEGRSGAHAGSHGSTLHANLE